MEAQATYGDQVNFIGVPGLSDADSHREFVESTGTGAFQHVDDQSQELWNRFGVTRQRTYVYINDDGTFEQAAYGTLFEDIEALLAN